MRQFNVVFCETNGSLSANATAFFADDADINLIVCQSAKEVSDVLKTTDVKGLVIDVSFERCKELAIACKERGATVILLSKNMEDEVDGALAAVPHEACFYKPYSFLEIRTQLLRYMIQQSVSVKLNTGIRNIDE